LEDKNILLPPGFIMLTTPPNYLMRNMEVHCIPFYKGFLKIVIKGGYVTRLTYVEEDCQGGFDESLPAVKKLVSYVNGEHVSFEDVPVKYEYGSDFDRRVWSITRTIPYGEVRTYGWIAERLGGVKYSRAVGNSLGRNPIMIIVPCHRVVRSGGGLGGFSSVGGLELKKYLLRMEGVY